MTGLPLRFSIGVFLACAGIAQADLARDVAATVVVFNATDAGSRKLAEYYAKRRGIPRDQLVGLECALAEEIPRAEFEKTIAAPLRAAFFSRGWWKGSGGRPTSTTKRFVAVIRGVPLKVAHDPALPAGPENQPAPVRSRNDASVDSELTLLGARTRSPAGIIDNPAFRRFTPVLDADIDPGMLFVSRLDAPTEIAVRAMIDDSLVAERDGLWGWAVVDTRGLTTGEYAVGDAWLNELAANMRRRGVPVWVDKSSATLAEGFPVSDVAVYYGWYAGSVCGPWADPGFRFRPGAIAVHLHSFSAATLRQIGANWCGPLVERGAAVTLGNVYEPFLILTTHLHVFQDRLMAGFNVAESGWIATPTLSWMNVVIGDPLYRPYAAWSRPGGSTATSWQRFRSLVLAMSESGDLGPALFAEATRTKAPMMLEALANTLADEGKWIEADAALEAAARLEPGAVQKFRILLHRVALNQLLKRPERVVELGAEARGAALSPAQRAFIDRVLVAPSAPSDAP